MAFKKPPQGPSSYKTPYELFNSLTGREFPDLMQHQIETTNNYVDLAVDKRDVALQLPTGSGKTLVGLLIAEWRRRNFGEKVIYLCPTSQLAHQTHLQATLSHKIGTALFVGSRAKHNVSEKSHYELGKKIAITNFSSLFNTNTAFHNPDTIIIDDAHSAENYVSKMWTVEIKSTDEETKTLFEQLTIVLKPHISNMSYHRLCGDWDQTINTGIIEKLPTPIFYEIMDKVRAVISEGIAESNEKYPWKLIQDHLSACQFYFSASTILIRPLIPPTWTLKAFSDAKRRIFMSATLGKGGDLERLTGRRKIFRLPTPERFNSTGVGRRFFIFPELQFTPDEADKLRIKLIKKSDRSVVITPTIKEKDRIKSAVEDQTTKKTFSVDDIIKDKGKFTNHKNAVALLANRYDGMDFPNSQSRLLCVDGLPKATNLQERFLMTRMGALVLLNQRIQTRVIQAIGRCTRSLQDYSAIYVTGRDLQEALTDSSKQSYFTPELQAEIEFGIDQSLDTSPKDILENFETFIKHDDDWKSVNELIVRSTKVKTQKTFPALEALQKSVPFEIDYQKAIWAEDFKTAMEAAKKVQTEILSGSELRGYRGLWVYLAGSAAFLHAQTTDDRFLSDARNHYNAAIKTSDGLSWISKLAKLELLKEESSKPNDDINTQLEIYESNIRALGTLHDKKFVSFESQILNDLKDGDLFESAHEKLGRFLGFHTGKVENSGSPDPWWMSENLCFVFEDHANAKKSSAISVTKARQASSHPEWIKDNVDEYDGQEIISVLVSPVEKADYGAFPHLKKVGFWKLKDFRKWAKNVFVITRQLRTELKDENDLIWLTKAISLMEENMMTAATLKEFFIDNTASEVLKSTRMTAKDSEG